jgi:hypothetical protein
MDVLKTRAKNPLSVAKAKVAFAHTTKQPALGTVMGQSLPCSHLYFGTAPLKTKELATEHQELKEIFCRKPE